MLPSLSVSSNLNLDFHGEIRTTGLYSSLKKGRGDAYEGLYFMWGYTLPK